MCTQYGFVNTDWRFVKMSWLIHTIKSRKSKHTYNNKHGYIIHCDFWVHDLVAECVNSFLHIIKCTNAQWNWIDIQYFVWIGLMSLRGCHVSLFCRNKKVCSDILKMCCGFVSYNTLYLIFLACNFLRAGNCHQWFRFAHWTIENGGSREKKTTSFPGVRPLG